MHGTNAEHLLGKPASHGCVRLSKKDAKTADKPADAATKEG